MRSRGCIDPETRMRSFSSRGPAAPASCDSIFEELFLFELGLGLAREGRRGRPKTNLVRITKETREAVKDILPFRLTGAQKRVLREIADDMRSPQTMHRLVQGDVGSGKTLVALLSMVVAVLSGYQAAFMAPTEILAEQHYLTFRRLLARTSIDVSLLTSARKGRERKTTLERLRDGSTGIAVGTHALIQEAVTFSRLALAVVDEQHRFGVLQREELRRKGYECDLLVMTATPIPRTLALTAYGDLDVSVVDEKPPGRTPIRTVHKTAAEHRSVVELVRREVALGRQAYVVYPLVEESEKLEDVRAATAAAEEWRGLLAPRVWGCSTGVSAPGRRRPSWRPSASGELHVLVSTTVIEVGVDVPNATVMVVEHAERFGLAQLHQLRGRVGRGGGASTCVLLTHGRLSEIAAERIDVLVRTEDGFVIAEKDLEIRGPGDFFGTRQWGMPTFRVAHLVRDRDLLESARTEAFRAAEALAAGKAHPELAAFVQGGAWERRFGLSRVG